MRSGVSACACYGGCGGSDEADFRHVSAGLTIWCTPTIGLPSAAASVLAAFDPTLRQPPIPVSQCKLLKRAMH